MKTYTDPRSGKSYPRSIGSSSTRFGNCEVCKKYVSDVHITTTQNGQNKAFGHKECIAPLTDFFSAQASMNSYDAGTHWSQKS